MNISSIEAEALMESFAAENDEEATQHQTEPRRRRKTGPVKIQVNPEFIRKRLEKS